MKEAGEKKRKKKKSKVKEEMEDEKGGVKKKEEKRKKKEDPSLSGQEPNSGTMVDAKVMVAVQPPGAGVSSVIDGEVSFILHNQSRLLGNDPDSPSRRHNRQRRNPS